MYKTVFEKQNQAVLPKEKALLEALNGILTAYKADDSFKAYFTSLAGQLVLSYDYMELNESGKYRTLSMEELQGWNKRLYENLYEENYGTSFVNPEYAVKCFGETGKYLSYVADVVFSLQTAAASGRRFRLYNAGSFVVELYEMALSGNLSAEEVKAFLLKKTGEKDFYENRCLTVHEMYNPEWDFYTDIINNADLTDLRYLYFYGKHVTKNELDTASFLNSLSQEEVQAMADTFTEGYLTGYARLNKDIHNKKTVALYYSLGFERMERCVVQNMKKEGITCISFDGYCTTTEANRQADYDHKDDLSIYLSKEYVEKYLAAQKNAMESEKANANGYAGPLALETFGEKEFNPVSKKESLSYTDEQQGLMIELTNGLAGIRVQYVFPEERSFSIISYPIPEIGEKFREIFAETVKVNTLDYKTYEDIQQKLIDQLDTADHVVVKGIGANKTDLTIKVCPLSDPKTQSAFENCVADVNIPVGEVFTSPVLKGTNGMLNVSEVYLDGMLVKDLELVLTDGMVTSVTCSNFDNAEDNKKYLDDVLMFHHDSLPIGEFAIGTNTTAYKMGIDYDCQAKLPVLIAEKTGPHFAMGDTCYSRSEEIKVFNPDGKEIIAKDNDVSLLRKEDPSKAYMNCHTDITIPYNELDYIEVVRKDGTKVRLIDNGRFVLEGTEELNKPLIALYGE